MELGIEWFEALGLDTESGVSFTGGRDKYISAVCRFFNNYDKNRTKAESFFEAKDYENYMIIVHSLKSNAKMIGASELSKGFEALEMASRNGDTATILSRHSVTMADYKALIEKLAPVGELGQVKAADEISAEVALETARKILDALDDFDDDLAKELADKLAGYPFRITQKNKLKEARDFIEDFMYEEAAELINEIMPSIE